MKAINRVDGLAKALTGLGLATFGVCFTLLGFWQTMPAAILGAGLMGQGLAQAATGWKHE